MKIYRLKRTLNEMRQSLDVQYDCVRKAEIALEDIYKAVEDSLVKVAETALDDVCKEAVEDSEAYLVAEAALDDIYKAVEESEEAFLTVFNLYLAEVGEEKARKEYGDYVVARIDFESESKL